MGSGTDEDADEAGDKVDAWGRMGKVAIKNEPASLEGRVPSLSGGESGGVGRGVGFVIVTFGKAFSLGGEGVAGGWTTGVGGVRAGMDGGMGSELALLIARGRGRGLEVWTVPGRISLMMRPIDLPARGGCVGAEWRKSKGGRVGRGTGV